MPFRFALFVNHLLLVWLLATGATVAQVPAIQLNIEKLRAARTIEQQAVANNDSLLLGKAYYLFGETYNFSGSNATAKEYYLKATRVLEPLGDSYELGLSYLRLGDELLLSANSTEDFQYTRLAIRVFQRINSPKGLAQAYNRLTSVYKSHWLWPGSDERVRAFRQDRAKFDTIVYCIKKIEQFGYQAKDTLMIAEANLQFGDLFKCLNDKRSIHYIKTALNLVVSQKNDTSIVHTLCHLGMAYMKFGQPSMAFQLLNQAQHVVNEKGIREYWMATHIYEAFIEYYQTMGQWKDAFYWQQKWFDLHNYRLIGEKDGTIDRLKLESEAELREAHLENQQRELIRRAENLRSQQRFTMGMAALFIVTAGLSVVFFRLYRKNQRIGRRNEELVKEQNHRVKNNLQVISSLLSLQSRQLTDEAAKIAINESRLRVQSMAILHQRLYDGGKLAAVNLDEFIRELVSGVLIAYGYSFVPVHYRIDEFTLSADKAVPLGLILNELVTNACKYAFPDNEHPLLRISCSHYNKKIELTVTDNGPGLEVPVLQTDGIYLTQTKSFGMALIQSQVLQLNGLLRSGSDSIGGASFTITFTV